MNNKRKEQIYVYQKKKNEKKVLLKNGNFSSATMPHPHHRY